MSYPFPDTIEQWEEYLLPLPASEENFLAEYHHTTEQVLVLCKGGAYDSAIRLLRFLEVWVREHRRRYQKDP